MPTWNSEIYLRYENQRTQPSIDLANRVDVDSPRRIVDLGCGPGNSTQVLCERWPESQIIGLDNSAEMLQRARASITEVHWVEEDIATWSADEPWAVVFSNAALQWLPDHQRLFPHLLEQVAPGGALAIQMPAHYESSMHRAILETAQHDNWRDRMTDAMNSLTRHPPSFYYDVLNPVARRLDLWTTDYYHVLENADAIVDWFRGTGLRPYLEALRDDDERRQFESMLLEATRAAFPAQPDGNVLFPFRRLFMIAYA